MSRGSGGAGLDVIGLAVGVAGQGTAGIINAGVEHDLEVGAFLASESEV